MTRDLGLSLLALLTVAITVSSCRRATVEVYDVPKERSPAPSVTNSAPPPSLDDKGWIQWTKPSNWTELAPTAFRKGNYIFEGEGGANVEITVSSFPGNVGGTLANVNRWRGQAGLPSISNDALSKSLTEITIDGHSGQVVNILPESSEADAVQIVAAIFLYQGESWFFKMSGPQQLVATQKAIFDQFIGDLKFTNTAAKRDQAATIAAPEKQILAFDPPEGWIESTGSSLRVASYQIALEGIDPADFSITSFPGDAGGIKANVNRWRQQIGLRPWNDAQVNSNKETLKAGNLEFALFDLKPQTEFDKERVSERILAAILKSEGRSWFYKLKGDIFLVETQRSKFRQLVQSSRFETENSSN